MSSLRRTSPIRDSFLDSNIRGMQVALFAEFKEILDWIQYLIKEYMDNIDRIFLGGAQDKFSILNNHVQKLQVAVKNAETLFPEVLAPPPPPDYIPYKPTRTEEDVTSPAAEAEAAFKFGSYQGTTGLINACIFLNVSIEMLLNDSPIDPDANAFAYSFDKSMHRTLMIGCLSDTVNVTKPTGGSYNYRSGYFVPCYPGFGYTKYLDTDTNNDNFAERKGWNTWTDFKNLCEDNREKYPLTGIPSLIANAPEPVWAATSIDSVPFVPMYPEIVDTKSITTDSGTSMEIDSAATVHYVGYKLIWHIPYFTYVFDTSKELLENIKWAITNIGIDPTKDYERYVFYTQFKDSVSRFSSYTLSIKGILEDIKSVGDQLESPLGQSLLGNGSNPGPAPMAKRSALARNKIFNSRRSRRVRASLKPTFKETDYVKH